MSTATAIELQMLRLLPRLKRVAMALMADEERATATVGEAITAYIRSLSGNDAAGNDADVVVSVLRVLIQVWRRDAASSTTEAVMDRSWQTTGFLSTELPQSEALCIAVLHTLEEFGLPEVASIMSVDLRLVEHALESARSGK